MTYLDSTQASNINVYREYIASKLALAGYKRHLLLFFSSIE